MLAAKTGAEGMFVVEPGWESITLLIPPQDIRMHLRSRQREDEFRMPHGVEILQADTDKVRGLFAWCKRLVDVAARLPTLFGEGKKERDTAQVELLENLLATLGAAHDLVPARAERTLQARNRVVKIAEDYALAHVDESLYVSDLCRAAAVSERTLEALFKETMGLTPMAYLVRLRLHRVRQALVDATHGSTTVSAEALNWGFWHFGEFSRAYKDCFGELPSDTLRRKPGALRT
jgi:AraC-like DNA-binding protein